MKTFYNLDGNQIALDKVTAVSKVIKNSRQNPYNNRPATITYYFHVFVSRWKFLVEKEFEEEVKALRFSLLRVLTIDEDGMTKPIGDSVSGYRKVDEVEMDITGLRDLK